MCYIIYCASYYLISYHIFYFKWWKQSIYAEIKSIAGYVIDSSNTGSYASCTEYELLLSSAHDCSCQRECSDGLFCNSLDYVKERLSDSSATSDDLCDTGSVCCCSCPNCNGMY